FLDNLGRLPVASALQVGVDEVVHCVQLFTGISLPMCGSPGSQVGCDGVVPHTQASEDMRGHMQRMRSRGSDAGVGSGGCEAAGCELLAVAGMDEVVRDSGVIGILAIERLKQSGGLLLLEMSLVGWRRVGDQRERVKDLCLNVGGICLSEAVHRG